MTDANKSVTSSRRDVLRATGGAVVGAVGVTTMGAVSAQTEAPASEEYESILDGMDGSGSESDPYVVTDVVELQAVEGDVEAAYVLGSDIDASPTSDWNDGQGFNPLGNWDATFTGSFDGAEYVITGLTINRPDSDSSGLFYDIGEGGAVERVGLENVDVTGKRTVGGLAGLTSGQVSQCFTTGSVTATGSGVGGLVGQNLGEIATSYSTASVSGDRRAIGGLVGTNNGGGSVSQCYAAGSVPDGTGGLVGSSGSDSTVEDSYWNADSISFSAAATPGASRTEAEMKGEAAGNGMTNFDFENTWRTVTDPDGFPQLQWVPTESGTPEDGGGDGGSGDTPAGSGPGFGVGGALAGVTSAGYLLKRRLRDTDEE